MTVAGLAAAELVTDDMLVYRDVMVPMRDGIRLATDIYVPVHTRGPFPTVLERTPYGKAEPSRSEVPLGTSEPLSRAEVARHFVTAGFAVVYQDCRCRYGSEGKFVKYLSEGEDGFDTMAWLIEQDWCNDRIGTMGLSYAAHTQMALACLNAPGLAAMVVDSGGFASAFRCGIRQGGAFELKQATWAYNRGQESPMAQEHPEVLRAMRAESLHGWMKQTPWTRGRSPVRWDPDYEAYLLD